MSVKLSLFVLCAVFGVSFSLTTQERVNISKTNVTVYYEALCKDSAMFVTKQVYPLLITNQSTSIAHYVDVTFVPFGKAKVINQTEDGMYNFECHHGPEECLGNKYQACAIKHVEDKMSLQKYINCTMAQGYLTKETNYSVGKKCADELKLDSAMLETCANGKEGNELLAMFGNKTAELMPALTSVPTVTFNDMFNAEKQTESMKNLQSVLCKEIPNSGKLVAECAAAPNSAPAVLGASIVMLVTATLANLY
uniref:GILT-like protein F37H8.5 n=1 Tax=Cacopsylla melanoneura TaxID=428564 RepID=A0A8D8PV95_9HEMI